MVAHRSPRAAADLAISLATPGPVALRRILCTHRDAVDGDELVQSFRRAGFDARGCADGEAALLEVVEFRPHACVFDLETAGIGGCELAHWVRALTGGLPFLIGLAGETGDDLDQIAASAGFDLVVERPADSDLLIGLLSGHRSSRSP
jgi:DNA-binding response OmpR family regulator